MQIKINPSDKILIIAPHPDDEVIAVGGFISKYHNQIDILCVNSSGIKYKGDTLSAEEIAQIRIEQFYDTAKKAGVNKTYIEKLWGEPVMIEKMESHYDDYLSRFNMKDYDYILVPHKDDNHPEHRWVGNTLLKNFLSIQGYKENLKILRYELWSPIAKPNYFEDITDFVEAKKELICNYKNRGEKYCDKILGLNKYRTLTPYLNDRNKYVEAFYVEDIEGYLKKTDIINKKTDRNFSCEKFENYLKEQNTQDKIDELAETYKDKRVVIYGAGEYTRCLFKNYDLSKLNIVAISDKRFEDERSHEFYGLNCIKPEDLKEFDCDVILVSNYNFINLKSFLENELLTGTKNKNIVIEAIVKKYFGI